MGKSNVNVVIYWRGVYPTYPIDIHSELKMEKRLQKTKYFFVVANHFKV